MIATMHTETALCAQVEALAREVGRLRRRAEPETTLAFLADRMAETIETLDAIVQPCAAELHQDGVTVDVALATVDARVRTLRSLLGQPKAAA